MNLHQLICNAFLQLRGRIQPPAKAMNSLGNLPAKLSDKFTGQESFVLAGGAEKEIIPEY